MLNKKLKKNVELMKLLRYSSGSFFPGAILLSSYRPRIARKTYDLPEKMCSLYRATAALASKIYNNN